MKAIVEIVAVVSAVAVIACDGFWRDIAMCLLAASLSALLVRFIVEDLNPPRPGSAKPEYLR